MKKLMLGGVALVLLATGAQAADLPRKAPALTQAPAVFNWTGWYFGGHVGGHWRNDDTPTGATGGGGDDGSLMGGVQIGFDYQLMNSPLVAGFEANYSFVGSGGDASTFPGGFSYTDRTRGLFSATGRIGVAWGQSLWYFKGGYAYRDRRQTFTGPAGAVAFTTSDDSRDGYTLGGGVEYMFMPNWSVKAEYQYYDFGSTTFTAPALLVATGGIDREEHTVKVGLNWRFNMPGSAGR
jgi:outer membrane immunogenic protein